MASNWLIYIHFLGQYEEHGEDFVDMLDGMFSFVLLDTRDRSFIAARDAIGVTPLYLGWGLDGMYFKFFLVRLAFMDNTGALLREHMNLPVMLRFLYIT